MQADSEADPISACLCFTGHRALSRAETETLRALLPSVLEEYFRKGIRIFLSGGALGFDTLAAQAVLLKKQEHPEIQLVLALPCRSQASKWAQNDRQIHEMLIRKADRIVWVSEDYFPGCMQKRNRYMIDHAETCLCYLKKCRGGTWYTVSYAYDCGRAIRNLALEKS